MEYAGGRFQAESYGAQAASGGMGLGLRNMAEPLPSNGRVTDAIAALVRTSDNLAQEVAVLEQRLGGVLRPAGPTGSANTNKANVAPSPLASGLEEIHERLYGLLGHIQSLTARVDL